MFVRRKTVIGAAVIVTALGLGAPAASAHSPHGGDEDTSNGVVNVSDNNIGPVQVCNNDVPVNVLGVQVPISDVAGAIGLLSEGTTTAVVENECKTGDYHAD